MSTPIETNTEQLQEVLQQVYNLPNRSGGNTWDCVITTVERPPLGNSGDLDFSVVSGSLLSVWEKVNRGEKPNVLYQFLGEYEGDYFNTFCEATGVEHFGLGEEGGTSADTPGALHLYFFTAGEYWELKSSSQTDITNNIFTTYNVVKLT